MKRKYLFLIIIICIIGVGLGKYYTAKKTSSEFNLAENIVKEYINALDMKDIKKMDKFVLSSDETKKTILNSEKNKVQNIINIKYIKSEPANVKYKPEKFHINGKEKEFKKGVLIDVTYDVKYKKNNQPDSNGRNSMLYEMVWDSGTYKISSISTGP